MSFGLWPKALLFFFFFFLIFRIQFCFRVNHSGLDFPCVFAGTFNMLIPGYFLLLLIVKCVLDHSVLKCLLLFYCFVFIFRDYNYKNAGSLIPTFYQLFWWILLASLFHKSNFLSCFFFGANFHILFKICYPWATCKLVSLLIWFLFHFFFWEFKISFHLFVWGGCFTTILTFCVCDSMCILKSL